MTATILATLFTSLVGILIFLYFFRRGQFDGIEAAKYLLFRNDDEEKVSRKSYYPDSEKKDDED